MPKRHPSENCPSDEYQYKFMEQSIDQKWLESFPDNRDYHYEEREILREQLLIEVTRIIDQYLTEHQQEVIKMYYFNDLTQKEIANKIGCDQSSVSKSLFGNIDYQRDEVVYGGSIEKLKKYCYRDPIILDLLAKIEAIYD